MNKKALSPIFTVLLTSYLPAAALADTASTNTTVGTTTTSTATTVNVDAQYHDDASYLQHIQPQYLSTAGSRDNLSSIVNGLRTGTPITLQNSTTPTGTPSTAVSFTSPTKPMGYGNITHTLDLASRELAAAGITSPTADQLHTALMGGTVVNASGQSTTLQGVLQLRSQGMGWGQIAHTLGVSPSPYSKAATSAQTGLTAGTAKSSSITTAGGTTHTAHITSDKPAKTGIVTAGGSAASSHAATGHTHSGIVTAAGTNGGFSAGAGHAGHGSVTLASGGSVSGGITSANASSGHGNAYGKSKD